MSECNCIENTKIIFQFKFFFFFRKNMIENIEPTTNNQTSVMHLCVGTNLYLICKATATTY